MKYKLTFALVAALTSTAFAEFKAPLPEFKNEKQLAEWRAEKASEATSQGYKAEETAFYTGKPYLATSGGYAFKFRSYNPALLRWTSEDPGGFPNGANQHKYAPNPIFELDSLGLEITKFAKMGYQTLWDAYSPYKMGPGGMQADGVYAAVGGELNSLHIAGGLSGDYYDSCALRMDIALYSTGIRFPNATSYDNGNFGEKYIIASSAMRSWLDSTSPFTSARSDRTLGNGASGFDSLLTDMNALEDKLGHPVVAILSDGWHTGVVTSKGIGYIDPHAYAWKSTSAPKAWVLE